MLNNEKINTLSQQLNIKNIYLDSGGIYGYTICGCLQVLKDFNLLNNIENILGCSVGGLVGMLFALDYTTEEIFRVAYNLDINKLINFKKNNLLNIFSNYGFDDGEKLKNIIKYLIKKKI